MPKNKAELQLDAKLENIPEIVDFVTSWMRRHKLNDIIFAVETAVDEACANIIDHAYSGKGGPIHISCEFKRGSLVIAINDKGRPFDPHAVKSPDLEADLDKRKIGGLGIHIMRKLMDDVSYSFDAKKGNTLVMKKALLIEH